jgi:capsular exopolysaccharide synthesis family protein
VSKNFELIQKADQDQQIFLTGNVPAASTAKNGHVSSASNGQNNGHHNGANNGHMAVPSIDHITREEMVKLVQRLFHESTNGTAPRVVLFSGVEPSVGCTTICNHVAETLISMWDVTCCIVDANIRKPMVHDYFGLRNDKGLAGAIANRGGASTFASQIYGGKLWVMPAGQTTANANALLNSPNLAGRIAELRDEFGYVIIDCAPANLYNDAVTLGRLCDGVVLVLQSDTTRRDVARRSKESLDSASIPVLGAVLNRRTYPIPQKLYEKL